MTVSRRTAPAAPCGAAAGGQAQGRGFAAWPPTPGCSSSWWKTPAAPAVPGSSCIVDSIAPHRAGGAVWRCGRRAGPGQGLCGVAAHAGLQQQLVEDAGGAGSAGQQLHR
ncbi:hypothetical protein [Janthinobacterium sp. 35]|uniref:hypothetical protein n=1 Tax=Janthinobacterium sp. 35 TaxID=2035210 RepID=UPI000C180114|nr:hypothetical protein [Janthinobacterium sp. 35]